VSNQAEEAGAAKKTEEQNKDNTAQQNDGKKKKTTRRRKTLLKTEEQKEDKAEKEGQEQQGDFDDTGFQQQARPFALKFPMKIGVLLDCDRQQVTFYVNGEELATLSTVVEQPGTPPGTQPGTPPGTPPGTQPGTQPSLADKETATPPRPIAYLPVFGIAGMNQDYSITLLPPPPLTSLPRGPIHQTTKYKEGGNTHFSVGLGGSTAESTEVSHGPSFHRCSTLFTSNSNVQTDGHF
jgi:hypothetical protein